MEERKGCRAQTRTPESQKGVSATMDRRTFATLAGAAAAAIALPGCASEKRDLSETAAPETKDSIAAAQQEEFELFRVTSGYNCCYCTIQGYKRDGKIVYIEPGELPNMPERNHACQRCMSWCKSVTDVDRRLLYPMKRTGERGSGEFERISWDEAIDLMAEKLSAAIAKDPRSASFYIFTGNMCTFDWFAPARMAHCLGASTWAMGGHHGRSCDLCRLHDGHGQPRSRS